MSAMKGKRDRLPTGTLRLRGSTYWAQWKHDGRPYAVSLGTKDAKEAKSRFAQQMTLVKASILDGSHTTKFGPKSTRFDTPSEDGDVALSVAWECFAASPRRPDCSPETLLQYGYQFGRFVDWAAKNRPNARMLSHVDEGVAEAYATQLEHQVSPSTFNRHRDLLLMVFRVLRDRNGHSPSNPWAAIQRKHAKNGNGRREFDDEELRRIFLTLEKRTEGIQLVWGEDGTIKEHALGDHDRDSAGEMLTVATLGLYTGMRLGDCCRLRWDEVDLGKKVIFRRPSKTARRSGRSVVVPIHSDLLRRLLVVKPDAAKGFVSPRKAEQYRNNKSDVSKRFSTLFRQCGIRLHREGIPGRAQVEAGFHSLRFSFVSICRRANAPLAVVERLVGHSTPAMTRHYTDVGDEAVIRAIASLPSMLAGGTPAVSTVACPATDVSAMGDDEFKKLAAAVAAEAARRKG